MTRVEPTLKERAGRMYRRLLLLQHLFQLPRGPEDAAWLTTDDRSRDLAFGAAVREVLDEVGEHARQLAGLPFPISEWRPGDGPDDERWRALTEVERREVRSLLACYAELVEWAERVTDGRVELAALVEVGRPSPQPDGRARLQEDTAADRLRAERARLARFRRDLEFLTRKGGADAP